MCSLCFVSSSFAQNRWEDLAGEYFLDSAIVKGLRNVVFFSLEPSDHWKYLDTSRSGVHFFPSDSVRHHNTIECPMVSICVENDSIYFSTSYCGEERFTFAGRFTRPANQFQHHYYERVLEGVLSYFRRGFPAKCAKVSFRYKDFSD